MKIVQRAASLADASILLKWRNDSIVREFSLNSHVITSSEHAAWFSSRLERQESEPFSFFDVADKTVGMTRLDIFPELDKTFALSILVDPILQGQGIGGRILVLTCENFFERFPHNKIVAIVKEENQISHKLFQNANFTHLNRIDGSIRYIKTARSQA